MMRMTDTKSGLSSPLNMKSTTECYRYPIPLNPPSQGGLFRILPPLQKSRHIGISDRKLAADDLKTSRRSPSPDWRTGLDLRSSVCLAFLAIATTAPGAIASAGLNGAARNGFPTGTVGAIATKDSVRLAQGFLGQCAIVGRDTFIYKRRNPDSQKIEALFSNERVRLADDGEDGWIAIDQPVTGFVRIADLSGFQDCNGQSVTARPIPTGPILVNQCRAAKQDTYIYQQPSTASLRIRQLSANSQVILASNGSDGWIAISSPERGFVQTDNLRTCDRATNFSPPPPNPNPNPGLCRRVSDIVANGLNIRRQPNTDSESIGSVVPGDIVILSSNLSTVDNQGRSWVEIEFPIQGWISEGLQNGGQLNLQSVACP